MPVMTAEDTYGFVDDAGRVRKEFVWDLRSPFGENGVARIMDDNNDGNAVNLMGEEILPFGSDHDVFFNQYGLALVGRDLKYGWVNLQGEIVVPLEWIAFLDKFGEGVFFDDEGMAIGLQVVDEVMRMGVVDIHGNVAVQPEWDQIVEFGPHGIAPAFDGKGWKLINRQGEIVTEIAEPYFNILKFSPNGLALVQVNNDPFSEGNAGWIDLKGNVVIDLEWDQGRDFDSFGLAPACRDNKWGWINEQGEIVHELKWDEVTSFNEHGYAKVRAENSWGAINLQGEVVIEPTWWGLELADDGNSAQTAKYLDFYNRPFGLVGMNGEVIAEPVWDDVTGFDKDGHALVLERSGLAASVHNYRLVNRAGEELGATSGRSKINFDDNGLAYRSEYMEGFYDEKGWIDKKFEYVIKVPDDWESAENVEVIEGKYQMIGEKELSGVPLWLEKVRTWILQEQYKEKKFVTRVYDKSGKIIFDNTWLTPATRAWIYFIATLLSLFVALLLGRRKKMLEERFEI